MMEELKSHGRDRRKLEITIALCHIIFKNVLIGIAMFFARC